MLAHHCHTTSHQVSVLRELFLLYSTMGKMGRDIFNEESLLGGTKEETFSLFLY